MQEYCWIHTKLTGQKSGFLKYILISNPLVTVVDKVRPHWFMFWSCPSLHNYWSNVFDTSSGVHRVPFHPVASTAFFGVIPDTLALPTIKADLVALLTVLARQLILLCWKSSSPPYHGSWIRDVLHLNKLEKIKYRVHFLTLWAKLLKSLDFLKCILLFPQSECHSSCVLNTKAG